MAAGDSVELNIEAIGADKVIKELEEYISTVEDLEKVSDIDLKNLVHSLEGTGGAAEAAIGSLEDLTGAFEELANTSTEIASELENTGSGSDQFASSLEDSSAGVDQLSTSTQDAGGNISQFATEIESNKIVSDKKLVDC